MIPLSVPNFEGNEEAYALDAVRQGWVSTGGAYILRFEKELGEFIGVPVAACQSGTAAIHLALRECGVGPGDLVIVPTLTFIAAVNPVRYQFADPIFMDCDDSLCMDPEKLGHFCEQECGWGPNGLVHKQSGRVVKAIVVVHVFGNLADMDAIMEIAGRYHLPVVEDATEALGSRFLTGKHAGKMAGTIGDYGAFSFNGNKIITTGGGGAITAADEGRLSHLRYLSTQAKDDELFYVHHEIGYNYRMTNLQAALGVAQLEELPEFLRRKRANYAYYCERLADFPKGEILPFRDGTEPNCWFYSLALAIEDLPYSLREVIEALREVGVQTRPVWGLIHQQEPYAGAIAYKIEKAGYYASRILNLPCGTQITRDEMDTVVRALGDLLAASWHPAGCA